MVEAFAPDRTDQPFDMPVLPGRMRFGRRIANAHGAQLAAARHAIGAVIVADEQIGDGLVGEGGGNLMGKPESGGAVALIRAVGAMLFRAPALHPLTLPSPSVRERVSAPLS